MNINRRSLLAGLGLAVVAPGRLGAESPTEPGHRPVITAPVLSEDPTAVPVQVSVAHPMEPGHFIRSLELALETDPVPYKGKFLFTPANGRAEVAFPMRSGGGGRLQAVAECTRHGRFTASRPIRVAEGGCTTPPDVRDRSRLGNPRIRLPQTIQPGEVIQVRTKVDHNSYTGLVLKDGRFVREAPEFFVKQMLVYLDDQAVAEFQMTSAVSANPLIRFPLRVTRNGTLRVVFVNNEGQRWETAQPIRL
jgi:desulfoferrodoxin (superoxide reductase-like protein)